MNQDRIKFLYERYLANTSTAGELQELKSLLSNLEHEADFQKLLGDTWTNLHASDLVELSDEQSKTIFDNILATPQKTHKPNRLWIKYAAAAVFIIVAGTGLLFLNSNHKLQQTPDKTQLNNSFASIKAGSNVAVLSLPDGKKINLRDESGIVIANNQVRYADGDELLKTNSNLSLITPNGGQYRVILADGTKVLLNAGTELKYPVAFSGANRTVELTGEAYFEVAKIAGQPFIVKTKNQEVKVLGTHFNINSYGDDDIKTTLLEGRVEVSRQLSVHGKNLTQSKLLLPGEQATVSDGKEEISVKNVNTTDMTDWKEGLFIFNDEPIKSITQRLSRWYNVEFVYKGDLSTVRFAGNYSRKKSLNNLLKTIELTGRVRFEMQGSEKERRIMVVAIY